MNHKSILAFMVLLLLARVTATGRLWTDKSSYLPGEPILISVSDPGTGTLLRISAPSRIYNFEQPPTSVRFMPEESGEYYLSLFEDGQAVADASVIVGGYSYLRAGKPRYLFGETVTISSGFAPEGALLQLMTPTSVYLTTPAEMQSFIPREEGNYTIMMVSGGTLLHEARFAVDRPDLRIIGSRGNSSRHEIRLRTMADGKSDAEMITGDTGVRKITFHGFRPGNTSDLLFETIDSSKVSLPGRKTDSVFAIDPTGLAFDNATITVVATGYELYKCREYDFNAQVCEGEYVKIMDTVPGQEYNITLTPEDPQYTFQTSQTQGCSCTNTCTTASGTSSQCTATCNDYCDINFTIPPGSESGWLEKVHYNVTITLSTSGTAISGSHSGRIDKDETSSSGNDVQVGISSIYTTGTNNVNWQNNNLDDSGSLSFDTSSCSTWNDGYCTWKPYLFTQFTCQGSRKSCTTTISLTMINYTWNYTADTTAPTITLGNPQNNTYTTQRNNWFYFTPNDNVNLRNCSIFINETLNQTNSTITKNVQTSFNISEMADQKYSWFIRCYDPAGNNATSGTRYLTVDARPPGLSFISPTPANGSHVQSNSVVLNISHIEINPDTLIIYMNGVPESRYYAGSYTNITKSGLLDGTYTYYAWANDSAGNINQTGIYNFTVDTVNPSVELQLPANNSWINNNSNVQFSYKPTDDNLRNCSLYANFSGIFSQVNMSAAPVSGSANTFTRATVNNGIYVWNVLCQDRSGRTAWAESNFTLLVDSSPPSVAILEPLNNTLFNLSNTILFNFTVTDNNNLITNCTLMYQSNVSTIYRERTDIVAGIRQNFTDTLSNNKYNWTITCQDQAKNTFSPGLFNLTVYIAEDLVGPSITPVAPANGNWTNQQGDIFYYVPSDQSLISNCSLYIDGIYNHTVLNISDSKQNNFTVPYFQEGSHDWYVSCLDNSSKHNEGFSATWTFYADRTLPAISQVYPQPYLNLSAASINFTWLAQDNMAGAMYCDLVVNNSLKADDAMSANNTYANQTVSLASDGTYFWNVTCRDAAYNYNNTPTIRFTLDTTPPQVSLGTPADGNYSLTGNTVFYYTPTDATIGLDRCYFYINSILNSTQPLPLDGKQNNFTLSNMGSGNYSWQINCTDKLGNLGFSQPRSLIVDRRAPVTNSFTALPQQVDLGENVALTANVTDDLGVSVVIAQVTFPDNVTRTNYTMSPSTGNLYTYTFTQTTQRGTYTVAILSNDTYTNKNVSQNYYFFVKPGIAVAKVYYDRGEQVAITGSGFDAGDNITINVTDPDGFLMADFPTSFLANSSGGFIYIWNISSSSGISTGNHTIYTYDTFQPSQVGKAYAYLVRKPSTALEYDKNNNGANVLSLINDSDASRALITASSGQDYIDANWTNIVPNRQVVSDLRLFLQHYETSPNNIYLQWYNGTSGQWMDICTIVSTVAEKIDNCHLNNYVKTSAQANNLGLRFTDKSNYGSAVGAWTNLNFAYIEVIFSTLLLDGNIYVQGDPVNITGSRWPANTELTLNITRSDGLSDLQTSSTNANGDFSTIYNISYGGSLGQYNLTVYVTTNPSDIQAGIFNVVKLNTSALSGKAYYGTPDLVNITGKGFSRSGNITLTVYDARNIMVLNTSVLAGSANGTIQYNWSVPAVYAGYQGLHQILVRDSKYSNLNRTINITVGIKPYSSSKTENSVATDILQSINDSDNVSAILSTYTGVEDYLSFGYANVTRPARVITNLTIYFQHNESQNYNLVVRWYNESAWLDVCNIAYSSKKVDSGCNLLPLVQRHKRADNITLKITDNNNNAFLSGQPWTYMDYAYLVGWTETDNSTPQVTVTSPAQGSVINLTQHITIRASLSDDVELDKALARIAWPGGYQDIALVPVSVDYFGDGTYEGNFTPAEVEYYNITFLVNDTAGNINNTQRVNFTVISGPTALNINLTSDKTGNILNWSVVKTADTYSIYSTGNLSDGYTLQASGIASLDWTDTGISGRKYYKVAAVKNSYYSISSVTAGRHTVQLYSGWNLISIPFNQTNWLLANGVNQGRDLYTDPAACLVSLWRYNSTNQSYERTDYSSGNWVPSIGSEGFTSLEKGRGYWAETGQACNLTLYGIVPDYNSSYSLKEYWNVVGFYSAREQPLYDESEVKVVDVQPQGAVSSILRYDSAEDRFEVTAYEPGWGWWPSYNNQEFTYLQPMEGYFFDNGQDGVWVHDPRK